MTVPPCWLCKRVYCLWQTAMLTAERCCNHLVSLKPNSTIFFFVDQRSVFWLWGALFRPRKRVVLCLLWVWKAFVKTGKNNLSSCFRAWRPRLVVQIESVQFQIYWLHYGKTISCSAASILKKILYLSHKSYSVQLSEIHALQLTHACGVVGSHRDQLQL